MKEWLNSVYSDSTQNYVSNPVPKLGEYISIRIRMRKNDDVKHVMLRTREYGIERLTEMEIESIQHGLIYYKADVQVQDKVYRYQFYVVTDTNIYYYTQYRITDYIPDETRDFIILADYKIPEWVPGSVFYQIFPDRFCNGDPSISVKDGEYSYQGYETIQVKDWNTPVMPYHVGRSLDYYGGDIEGIIQHLDYLQGLGVNGIYLNPIFLSPSTHRYDSVDYDTIDPHLGGEDALARLSKEIHRRGMKLILDISINHTSSAAKWFNKHNEFYDSQVGAYQNPKSQERKYYFFGEDNEYDTWCGVETMPKLNYSSQRLRDIIYRDKDSVLKKWISYPYNIDGWRFDVAECMARNNILDVHNEVLEEIREELKKEKEDLYLLAEDWADCSEDLQGNRWDGTMNYFGCARPIREYVGETDLFNGRDKTLREVKSKLTARQLSSRITQFYGRMPGVIQHQMFNLLDSHDVTRLHNNTTIHPEEYKGAVMMIFTLPGCSNVYYGDEIGLAGGMDNVEYCRYPMNWDTSENLEAQRRYEFYQRLIQLKISSKALIHGGFKVISEQGYVFAYARFNVNEVIIVICSTDTESRDIIIPMKDFGYDSIIEKTDYLGSELITYEIKGRTVITVLPHKSYLIRITR